MSEVQANEISACWQVIQQYVDDNLSIIPVRDKDEGDKLAKSPIGLWTYNQKHRYKIDELWHVMEKFNTGAVGAVCGKVSDNLEVIDIDSKYNPGIDATLFKDLESFYPEIWPLLRIHKTPSGGFHLLYRITGGVPDGSFKLAGRIPTAEEVEQDRLRNPKKKQPLKEINFLETRGEGGQIVVPPSLNYSVYRDVPIPVLTWEQRCSIINLCKTYTEIIKIEQVYKSTKREDNWYSVNPFEDFNKRCNPIELCENNGWKREKENNHFIWFTRPGKSKGVSLSWNKEKNIFYSFSSSTDLEASRGYNAASFLAIYQFNNDRKETYKWLVANGYGQIKNSVENTIVQCAIIQPTNLPPNLSEAARNTIEAEKQTGKNKHPHGTFWNYDDKHKIQISRERLHNVATGLGLMQYKQLPVLIKNGIIHKLKKNEFINCLKKYIAEDDEKTYEDICNKYEAFMEHSYQYTLSRFSELPEDIILRDSMSVAYKCYTNGIVKITRDKIVLTNYEDNDLLIWEDKILPRKWIDTCPESCKYTQFLHLAIGLNESLFRIIGYLSHDYKDENIGYIIICTETCPDPKQGGGSGKNLFGHLLNNTTGVYSLPSEQAHLDEKLLQSWDYQRVVMISDLTQKFNISWFKEISTGFIQRKRLFLNEETVSPYDGPKFLFNTNHSFDLIDGGLKRRIIPIEFTNFFTACGGVKKYFGGLFPTSVKTQTNWDENDWNGYDWAIAKGIHLYLLNPDLEADKLSAGGWEKQFKQNFGQHTYEFVKENFKQWCVESFIPTSTFNLSYEAFCKENNLKQGLSGIRMNNALKSYAEHYGFDFKGNYLHTTRKVKGKEFLPVPNNSEK